MTAAPVAIADLVAAREQLLAEIVGAMPARHRSFLLSFKRGEPDWSLLDVPIARELPAVIWKLRNVARLTAAGREALFLRLQNVLFRTASR